LSIGDPICRSESSQTFAYLVWVFLTWATEVAIVVALLVAEVAEWAVVGAKIDELMSSIR